MLTNGENVMSTIKNVIATGVTLLVMSTAPSYAQEERGVCSAVGDLAEVIMEKRQAGVPLSQIMGIVGGNEAVGAIVLMAYDTPRFSTQEYQDRAVQDFRNEVEVLCYQSM